MEHEMTTEVESAWPTHPDYRIDVSACPFTGQVWAGEVLIAEGDACLVVTETDHVDRLYFPESAVNVGICSLPPTTPRSARSKATPPTGA